MFKYHHYTCTASIWIKSLLKNDITYYEHEKKVLSLNLCFFYCSSGYYGHDQTEQQFILCRKKVFFCHWTPLLYLKRPAFTKDYHRQESCNSQKSSFSNIFGNSGPWEDCSATCGNGIQKRKVECLHQVTEEESEVGYSYYKYIVVFINWFMTNISHFNLYDLYLKLFNKRCV